MTQTTISQPKDPIGAVTQFIAFIHTLIYELTNKGLFITLLKGVISQSTFIKIKKTRIFLRLTTVSPTVSPISLIHSFCI